MPAVVYLRRLGTCPVAQYGEKTGQVVDRLPCVLITRGVTPETLKDAPAGINAGVVGRGARSEDGSNHQRLRSRMRVSWSTTPMTSSA